MRVKDILFYLRELASLNNNFIKEAIKNYLVSKKTGIVYDQSLIDKIQNEYQPLFVLSTGRCGTLFLTKLLENIKELDVLHTPKPEFFYYSRMAYQKYLEQPDVVKQVFLASRMELVIDSYRRNRIYVETNNRITFFAYAINEVFPKARFIHLIRHPADFVRSGVRREWYSGKDKNDLGRIRPGNEMREWAKYSTIEKISWLWNETNKFIEDFKTDLNNNERILTVKAEDLFHAETTAIDIMNFIGIKDVPVKKISKIFKQPVNVQKKGKLNRYSEWDEKHKNVLKKHITLHQDYNYQL